METKALKTVIKAVNEQAGITDKAINPLIELVGDIVTDQLTAQHNAEIEKLKADHQVALDKKDAEIQAKLSKLLGNFAPATTEHSETVVSEEGTVKRSRKAKAEPSEAKEVDAEAPYGRKKDGTPKGKPGRSKPVEAEVAAA